MIIHDLFEHTLKLLQNHKQQNDDIGVVVYSLAVLDGKQENQLP